MAEVLKKLFSLLVVARPKFSSKFDELIVFLFLPLPGQNFSPPLPKNFQRKMPFWKNHSIGCCLLYIHIPRNSFCGCLILFCNASVCVVCVWRGSNASIVHKLTSKLLRAAKFCSIETFLCKYFRFFISVFLPAKSPLLLLFGCVDSTRSVTRSASHPLHSITIELHPTSALLCFRAPSIWQKPSSRSTDWQRSRLVPFTQ